MRTNGLGIHKLNLILLTGLVAVYLVGRGAWADDAGVPRGSASAQRSVLGLVMSGDAPLNVPHHGSTAYAEPASPDAGVEAYAKRQTAPVAIPNTPAGRVLRAWLAAFNSGDRVRIEAYCKKYNDPLPPERMTSFARRTGGFDLVDIRASEPNRVVFLVRDKKSRTTAVGNLTVGTGAPTRVTHFFVKRVPPGMNPEDLDIKVDAALLARVLDSIETRLTEFYIYPDVAKAMVAAMRTHQKNGEYDGITDAYALAFRLTEDLQAVSHDRHVASLRPRGRCRSKTQATTTRRRTKTGPINWRTTAGSNGSSTCRTT